MTRCAMSNCSSADDGQVSVGYRSAHGGFTGKGYSISVNVNNLFNVHKLSEYAGTQKVSGDALYFGLPGRGVFLDLSMKL